MGTVVFITGPSGSGKSSTAEIVAHRWPSACALLDFDNIRSFIKSGFAEPSNGWNKETEKQWDLAKELVGAMTKVYLAHDISVILEAFATPHDYSSWMQLLKGLDYKTFALMPSLETVLARNDSRKGQAKLKENDVKKNYSWSTWEDVKEVFIIDSSRKSVNDVANEIIGHAIQQ